MEGTTTLRIARNVAPVAIRDHFAMMPHLTRVNCLGGDGMRIFNRGEDGRGAASVALFDSESLLCNYDLVLTVIPNQNNAKRPLQPFISLTSKVETMRFPGIGVDRIQTQYPGSNLVEQYFELQPGSTVIEKNRDNMRRGIYDFLPLLGQGDVFLNTGTSYLHVVRCVSGRGSRPPMTADDTALVDGIPSAVPLGVRSQ
jgi:hypothetical protein